MTESCQNSSHKLALLFDEHCLIARQRAEVAEAVVSLRRRCYREGLRRTF